MPLGHISFTKKSSNLQYVSPPCRPKRIKEFLQEEKLYTFAGFSIEGDKRMLKKSGLEINPKNFIDIKFKWRVPTTRKEYNSLAYVSASVIHPFYRGMKKNID